MKLPIVWLKKFVDIRDIKTIDQVFNNLGFEVESIENDVLDLDVTQNRGDALSIIGLAREYATSTKQELKYQLKTLPSLAQQENNFTLNIETDLINGYVGLVIKDVIIKESPHWIKEALSAVGIQAINNIVDITNYILLEHGQPLHAFDLDKISGSELTIKESTSELRLKVLNGKEYSVPQGAIVATDSKNAIDLVGIMGGENTGITQDSKNIFIHGLVVDRKIIRQISKLLKLSTDSSYRYERGVDPLGIRPAITQATDLILQEAGGTIVQIIERNPNYGPTVIKFDIEDFSHITGTSVSLDYATEILTRLGFQVNNNKVTVPSWRLEDITCTADIVEEIARVHGYNNLKKEPLPVGQTSDIPSHSIWEEQRKLAARLKNLGFSEIMTYSFLSQNEAKNTELVSLANPFSKDHYYLRSSLMPLLIKAAEANTWWPNIRLFEIGTVFTKGSETIQVGIVSNNKIDFASNATVSQENTRKKYYIWEGSVEELLAIVPEVTPKYSFKSTSYRPFSKFPPATRDIAFVVSKNIDVHEIRDTIFDCDSRVLLAELFDAFSSEKLGENNISYAFHIVLDDVNETMTSETGDRIMQKISQALIDTYQATIR